MQIAYIAVTTGVILSSVLAATTLVPGAFTTIFGANKIFGTFVKPRKKKSKIGKISRVCMMCSEELEESLSEDVIPVLTNLTGMEKITIIERDLPLGKFKVDAYHRFIAEASAVLIFVDAKMLDNKWLDYALAFCFEERKNLFLCWDQSSININAPPEKLKDPILVSQATIPFEALNKEQIAHPRKLAENISRALMWPPDHPGLQVCTIKMASPVKHPTSDAFIILGDDDGFDVFTNDQVLACVRLPESHVVFNFQVPLCTKKYQCYSEAIQSSRKIVVLLTPALVGDPLFEYQLKLALHYKGHKSIMFLLDKDQPLNLDLKIQNNSVLGYALRTCRKVIV